MTQTWLPVPIKVFPPLSTNMVAHWPTILINKDHLCGFPWFPVVSCSLPSMCFSVTQICASSTDVGIYTDRSTSSPFTYQHCTRLPTWCPVLIPVCLSLFPCNPLYGSPRPLQRRPPYSNKIVPRGSPSRYPWS